jgi:DNA-binding response OmpR family regulator
MTLSGHGKYRLLVVEDDKDVSELIVRTAVKCGYDSFPVHNARILPEVIANWRPDVVTLDHCLPNSEGFEAITALESVQYMGKLIIVSGQPEWLRKEAVKSASVSGLNVTADLPKPIAVAELRELLSELKARLSAPAGETPGGTRLPPVERRLVAGSALTPGELSRERGGAQFSLADGSDLPPGKLRQRYLQLSEDARREAAQSSGAVRESYLLIAERWERLAADLSNTATPDPAPGRRGKQRK